MGTVLSISPTSGREPTLERMDETKMRSLMKPRTFVSMITFKIIKQKSAVKVKPHPGPPQSGSPHPGPPQSGSPHPGPPHPGPPQSGSPHPGPPHPGPPQSGPPHPGPTQAKQIGENRTEALITVPSPKHEESPTAKLNHHQVLTSPVQEPVQYSTGELLLCLGRFMCRRCLRVEALTPNEVVSWFRNVDRTLLQQGWQEEGFITQPTLVFVYLLCRETISEDVESSGKLQGIFLTCLYLTYSYLGSEISYPLKPFIVDANKNVFWQQVLDVIDKLSSKMLRINMDLRFFTQMFGELKMEGVVKKDGSNLDR